MPISKIKNYLDQHQVKYVVITHSPAFTAQGIAQSAHICGHEVAKTVIVKIDGKMAMVVLPASYKVDFDLLKEATSAVSVEIANENEFQGIFPDCEIGAMPPFGNLYGLPVLVAERLTKDLEIAFNAGSHRELIKLPYQDFARLVQPKVVQVSIIAV